MASGLIDKIVYEDQYESALYLASDLSMDNKLNYINIYDYAEHVGHRPKITSGKNKIAVIYAEGEIIYGKGDKNFVGQGTISKSLREAAQDEQIKAIVLRVNSPGGSALAQISCGVKLNWLRPRNQYMSQWVTMPPQEVTI